MFPYCAFPNVQAAATAVHRFHKDAYAGVTLTARPYNRYDALNCTWWLIPSTQWPAYHLPKIAFYRSWTEEGESLLRLGLVAEKGFGRVVASIDPGVRTLIMYDGWFWPKLLRDVAAGALDSAVAQVAEKTGRPVDVEVDLAYYQNIERGDPYAPINHRDALSFQARDANLTLSRETLHANVLRRVAGVRTFSRFAQRLASVPDQDWTYCSLGLITSFRMVPLDANTALLANAWDEVQLWDRVIVPWLPWLR